MGMISYVENKNLLAQSIEIRDYKIVSEYIRSNKNNWTKFISDANRVYGYNINKVKTLSDLYKFDVYAIDFFFDNILSDFNTQDNQLVCELLNNLEKEIDWIKGYFIIRVPSSNTILINQLNMLNKKFFFAGNTICYYTNSLNESILPNNEVNISLATEEFKKIYKEEIINLSKKSFDNYFGQYHISHFTREKAPLIYRDWIIDYLDNDSEKELLLPIKDEKVIGFLAFDETLYTNEIVLNCVEQEFRGQKIYEQMLRKCVNLTLEKNKLVTISTQLNNYFPQRAWINCGFKPFHSFNLMHYNNLIY